MKSQSQSLTSFELFALTIALIGVQVTWSVELGYGNPFLLSLGVPKPMLSFVWFAGPLSGLIVQPIVGVWSDRCRSRFGKRRPFILIGTLLITLALLMISFCKQLAELLHASTIFIAVAAFYLLDFSVNAVQSSCRTLIVDVAPMHQQDLANAWASRMIGVANVFGYMLGGLDLAYYFHWTGLDQMELLCLVAGIVLIITTSITCFFVQETPASSWIAQMELSVDGNFPEGIEQATRRGSFGLLLFSLFSVILSMILPYFFHQQSTNLVINGQTSSNKFSLKRLFLLSQIVFAFCMFCTLFASKIWHAYVLLSVLGFCWAVSMWVPFSMIGRSVLTRKCADGVEEEEGASAGCALGIHNVYVVLGQIASNFTCSLVFGGLGLKDGQTLKEPFVPGSWSDAFGWALRVGGIGSLGAILMAWKME